MVGLSGVSAAVASLLLNLEGLFTILIAWRMFGENLGRRIALGAALILAGATLLSWQGGGGRASPIAIAAIVGACFAWAIDNNLTRRLSAADPVQVAAVKGLVAGSVNLALALSAGAVWPAAGAIAAAGTIGFLGYGVSLVLFLLALRDIGTARTAAYFSAAPFLGASLAVPLLGEPITASLLIAALLIGAGVWLHLAERHEHRHIHPAMSHSHAHRHDLHHRHAHSADDPAGDFHVHAHVHEELAHSHPHYPDLHHAHEH
jgi:drug/metabolite transporter (DMT)-like permease